MPTWILTADRAGARLFERDGRVLTQIEEMLHDEGKLRDADLGSDQPGRTYDSARPGRHALGKSESMHEEVAHVFARRLASRLREGRVEHRFTRLVIAAEPRFLGMLRSALDADTARMVIREVPKHLQQLPPSELAAHVLPE